MLKKLAGLILVLFLANTPVFGADSPLSPAKWWQRPRFQQTLKISDAEKKALDEAYAQTRRNLEGLKTTVEKERRELNGLLNSDTMDEARLMEQSEKLEKARAALASEIFRFNMQVRKTLGPKRFSQLTILCFREQRKARGPGRGRMHGSAGPVAGTGPASGVVPGTPAGVQPGQNNLPVSQGR
jgi:Spy/CpxP family protein refolding chaperone